MASSTNCSSPGWPLPLFPPKMCWTCICTAGPLKRFWQMKTASKTPTAGVRICAFRQEFWQILCQWVWNLRLECGQRLSPMAMRTTAFAPACASEPAPVNEPAPVSEPTPPLAYGPPHWAQRSFTGGFPGSAFRLQADGSLLCPAHHPLYPQERRPERHGSYRLLYAARIGDCRQCELRAQCQESPSTSKPRRVSAVIFPLSSHETLASAPPIASPSPPPKPRGALPHA